MQAYYFIFLNWKTIVMEKLSGKYPHSKHFNYICSTINPPQNEEINPFTIPFSIYNLQKYSSTGF
jgi:hypothetical protein